MKDLQDGYESKQLAKLEKDFEIVGSRVVLTYTRLDGEFPKKGQTAGQLKDKISDEVKASVKALKAGDEVVIVKAKDGKFWNFVRIESKESFEEKPKTPTFTKGSFSGGNFNNAGVKVGAVLHDAVASLGAGATTKQIGEKARELLYLSFELETEVNDGKYKSRTTKSTQTTDSTKESIDDDAGFFEEESAW